MRELEGELQRQAGTRSLRASWPGMHSVVSGQWKPLEGSKQTLVN